jgi:hypothetical protein
LRVGVSAANRFYFARKFSGQLGKATCEKIAVALLLFPLGIRKKGQLLVRFPVDLTPNGGL